jgi:hypothetical protein
MVALALIGACSGSDSESGSDGGAADVPAAEPERGVDQRREMAFDSAGGGNDAFVTDTAALDSSLPAVGPAVIKTGELGVRVPEGRVQGRVQEVVDLARSHGGFVLSTTVEEHRDLSATVVLRIPAESFEDALAEARSLGEVITEQVSGEDVSQEFVDLDARLRNFEAQESVLLDLMAKSQSVADTLRVQRELQDVQLEIERLRGRLRFLRDQTDLSTLTVTLREDEPVVAGTSVIERAWKKSVETFNAIVSAIVIGLGVALPIAVLLLIVLLIARFLRPRLPSWGPRQG